MLYKGTQKYTTTIKANSQNIEPLTITKDGTYVAPNGVSGYNPIVVKNNNITFKMCSTHTDKDGVWHRPQDWDDIESIDLTDKHEVYFLCACHKTEHDWFRIRFYGSGTLSWSYGHVANGVYTLHANSTETTVSNGSYISLFLANFQDDYIVIRIKATTSISSCAYQNWAATSDLNCAMPAKHQSVLMRYGRMVSGNSIQGSSTYYLESDNIIDFAKNYQNTTTTIAVSGAYSNAYSLQRWRCTGWDLAKNKITTFASMFDYCYSLIDVPNPLNLDNWVTSNVTTVAAMFRWCVSLNTNITVNNWDLTNVTTLGSVFEKCKSVKTIEGLDTWNAAPKCTNASYIFNECCSLRTPLDLSKLYLGNGTANFTNISYAFAYCYACPCINISNTNLSKCTTLAYLAYSTASCKQFIMNNVTPITSTCTNTNYLFGYSGVEELVFNNWNFSGHTTNFLAIGFNYATVLKKLLFSNCTGPSTTIADTSNALCYCRYTYTLEYLDVSFLDMSIFSGTKTHNESFRDLSCLVDFYPPKNISKSFSLANNNSLSHDSLIRVINNLKTLSSGETATLTIGTYNISKLTAAEQAIATGKGWTLA